METDYLEIINGQDIEIRELSLTCINNQLELLWKVCFNNTFFYIYFYNVSRINIRDFSYPMQIKGFEIISNKDKNWDKDSSYIIRDFEEGDLYFFCEYFDIYDN